MTVTVLTLERHRVVEQLLVSDHDLYLRLVGCDAVDVGVVHIVLCFAFVLVVYNVWFPRLHLCVSFVSYTTVVAKHFLLL
jgi:hypothetical protein